MLEYSHNICGFLKGFFCHLRVSDIADDKCSSVISGIADERHHRIRTTTPPSPLSNITFLSTRIVLSALKLYGVH
ncbi:hypothetical protein QVD17_20199 [Tagetes erecta]|uniref:Uncharacterized protein n=1 Tax=Tagetes erecta TaxID=13708 RepID=A0AAD8KKV2_TARER|nr:hypothetical protein QVD17_20199 [Tagetes erecta]